MTTSIPPLYYRTDKRGNITLHALDSLGGGPRALCGVKRGEDDHAIPNPSASSGDRVQCRSCQLLLDGADGTAAGVHVQRTVRRIARQGEAYAQAVIAAEAQLEDGEEPTAEAIEAELRQLRAKGAR